MPIGIAEISTAALTVLQRNPDIEGHLLAGICRNAFELDEETPVITSELINSDFKKIYNLPKTTKEKALHLLKLLYKKGGNDFERFNLSSRADFTLTYSKNPLEFDDIINYLKKQFFIEIENVQTISGGVKMYRDIMLTDKGIDEAESDLPKIPLIGLVDQEITTGDAETDEKINHAKKLFFDNDSMDNKRSACEALSYVLEPLREDLKEHFSGKDINAFFTIVNTFDVRHNKDHTKNIEHPEQLEWVFFSLLNTINTYIKLKNRLTL